VAKGVNAIPHGSLVLGHFSQPVCQRSLRELDTPYGGGSDLWRRLHSDYDPNMKSIGKTLQVLGLVLLPFACLLEMSTGSIGRSSGLATMLIMMIVGVIAFILGRLIEGYAR
jgi:hypothetical protein